MRIALIADTFPPQCSSGAVQLRDLAREFFRQGHALTVLLPSSNQAESWVLEDYEGVQLLRLKAPRTKDIGYLRRTIAELLMPFFMWKNFRDSPLAVEVWDGVVWYSPSIFHGPLVGAIKKSSACKSYLIIRDIFPEWALDMGLMRRGLPYLFFLLVAKYQYSMANIIGVQAVGNKGYFNSWLKGRDRVLEVLNNWLDSPTLKKCTIQVSDTKLAGRKIFVYAGNMGIAQGIDNIFSLVNYFRNRKDVGFLFVGRGSNFDCLKIKAQMLQLGNILFFDEIHPDEIPNLYSQCSVGLVSLDPRHKSHNIPGKFLTYIQNGLPVLANVNSGNDLARLIREEGVGEVCESNQLAELIEKTDALLLKIESGEDFSMRCATLFNRDFGVTKAVHQIVSALSLEKNI